MPGHRGRGGYRIVNSGNSALLVFSGTSFKPASALAACRVRKASGQFDHTYFGEVYLPDVANAALLYTVYSLFIDRGAGRIAQLR